MAFVDSRSTRGELIKGVGIEFMDVYAEIKDAYVEPFGEMLVQKGNKGTAIAKVVSTDAAQVHFSGVSGTKLTVATAEGDNYAEDRRFYGYKSIMVPQKFTNSVAVTEEAREDTDRKYRDELDEYKALIMGAHQRESASFFDIFNYAFTAQSSLPAPIYPYGDGKPLCSTAHPRLDGGTAQANTFSSAVTQLPLSDTNLELARINLMRTLDSRGNPVVINKRNLCLVVGVENEKAAQILTMSTLRPGTANNDVNIYDGAIGLMVSSWITSTTAWFLIDSSLSQLMFIRRKPVSTHTVTDRNMTQNFFVSHRFCAGWKNWLGFFGSKGDSSAYAG